MLRQVALERFNRFRVFPLVRARPAQGRPSRPGSTDRASSPSRTPRGPRRLLRRRAATSPRRQCAGAYAPSRAIARSSAAKARSADRRAPLRHREPVPRSRVAIVERRRLLVGAPRLRRTGRWLRTPCPASATCQPNARSRHDAPTARRATAAATSGATPSSANVRDRRAGTRPQPAGPRSMSQQKDNGRDDGVCATSRP